MIDKLRNWIKRKNKEEQELLFDALDSKEDKV